jgi:hypothetical protein
MLTFQLSMFAYLEMALASNWLLFKATSIRFNFSCSSIISLNLEDASIDYHGLNSWLEKILKNYCLHHIIQRNLNQECV